jgi:hypothetical protein
VYADENELPSWSTVEDDCTGGSISIPTNRRRSFTFNELYEGDPSINIVLHDDDDSEDEDDEMDDYEGYPSQSQKLFGLIPGHGEQGLQTTEQLTQQVANQNGNE